MASNTLDLTCPGCGGKKQTFGFIDGVKNGKRFGRSGMFPCTTCKGTGEIDREHAERIARGAKARDRRVDGLAGLGVEARRLGVHPMQLSHFENGHEVEPESLAKILAGQPMEGEKNDAAK